MDLLKEISEANAVSGNEAYFMRDIAPEAVKKYSLPKAPYADSMGNVILFKKGRNHDKCMAVMTHTDEAGYIVKEITDKGFIKMDSVGDIDPRVIISKKVSVGPNKVKGIIGMKAIHLQKKEERAQVVDIKNLFVDIGAKNKKDAEKKVHLGDYISFSTSFEYFSEKIIKGKALDRAGVYCVLKAMDKIPEYDTYFIFAAQHHTGVRGASIVLEKINPSNILIVDTIESADMFGVKSAEKGAVLHGGPVIGMMDKNSIIDKELAQNLDKAAEKAGIKTQKIYSYQGGAAGAVRSGYGGRHTVVVSIPCRYRNTPVSFMSTEDLNNTTKIVDIFLGNKIG